MTGRWIIDIYRELIIFPTKTVNMDSIGIFEKEKQIHRDVEIHYICLNTFIMILKIFIFAQVWNTIDHPVFTSYEAKIKKTIE